MRKLAFIHENTEEIRDFLGNLGYTFSPSFSDKEDSILVNLESMTYFSRKYSDLENRNFGGIGATFFGKNQCMFAQFITENTNHGN